MSKTWFGHHIENIKGDDYVLFTDYVELEQKIDNLQQELDQYKNNWEELKKWVKENSWYYNTSDGCQWVDQFKILDKMKELEENNNGD